MIVVTLDWLIIDDNTATEYHETHAVNVTDVESAIELAKANSKLAKYPETTHVRVQTQVIGNDNVVACAEFFTY